MSEQQWATNLTVRTQISAFLAGTFFAVLLVFVTQQDVLGNSHLHYFLSAILLTATCTAFAFSTFSFGLSADDFRKGLEERTDTDRWEQRAKTAFYIGLHFFEMGYITMMFSLASVLAHAHWLLAIIGLAIFIGLWTILCKKAGFPYQRKR